MGKNIFFVILIILTSFYASGLPQKKQIVATKVNTPPMLDGILNDNVWNNVPIATDFIQLRPNNGQKATQISEVRFIYDDEAVYVGAMLYDTAPDSILTNLSKRDELGIVDYFGVYFDPYNDALNSYGFFVSAAGVQLDMKSSQYEDNSWNAVWDSEVRITDNGWVVEMRIPYSALRFSQQDVQTWGINVFRNIQRNRESTTWNFINLSVNGINNQAGEMVGIKDIKAPLRLAAMPYLTTYVEHYSGDNSWSRALKGGMDIKYGISESFTLDMMLIPDFGQVQSDDQRLNLSPFETYYGERRQFFMEGTELFNRADIFYSRRIGAKPNSYYDASNDIKTDNDGNNIEEVSDNPVTTQLVNATKITGKTQSGFGIGFINAMSLEANAEIRDIETGATREFTTQPFTNYNVLVLDQAIRKKSYVSLINTNIYQPDNDYSANVTGTEFYLENKAGNYAISGKGAISQKYNNDSENEFGHYYNFGFQKVSGNFKFDINHRTKTDTYNPNDMGYLYNNNEITNSVGFNYNIYKPFWKMLNLYNYLNFAHKMIYEPRNFTQFEIHYGTRTTFKNHFTVNINGNIIPTDRHDYYEPRVEGRKYINPSSWGIGLWASTDYRKRLAFDFGGYYSAASKFGKEYKSFSISPRLQISDKMLLIYEFDTDWNNNNIGHVETINDDTIYLAIRDFRTVENTLDLKYIFTNRQSLSFRGRHYWSRVKNKSFHFLNQDGTLGDADGYTANADVNYNSFNIDMVYTWNFAPGSELIIVWKNSISDSDDPPAVDYWENSRKIFSKPQSNSISLKLIYYLDYQNISRKFK